jgi:hypothetical protein
VSDVVVVVISCDWACWASATEHTGDSSPTNKMALTPWNNFLRKLG